MVPFEPRPGPSERGVGAADLTHAHDLERPVAGREPRVADEPHEGGGDRQEHEHYRDAEPEPIPPPGGGGITAGRIAGSLNLLPGDDHRSGMLSLDPPMR